MSAAERDRIGRVLADAGIRFAYLFGSRALGSARPDSDVDLAAMPWRDFGLLERERLADRLARALGVADVDLVMLNRAPLELRGRIVQDGALVFSGDEPARVAFEGAHAVGVLRLPAMAAPPHPPLPSAGGRNRAVMVDPDRVRRLLDSLAGYRTQLAGLSALPADGYLASHALAGRYLDQVCARVCIDIANHAIASEGWRLPRDFRDAFTVLEENAVLDPSLAERLRALAGLRNRLVHVYEEVDDTLVYRALPEGLRDLDAYARAVARLVE